MNPKKAPVLFVFPIASAVLSIPIGHGCRVILDSMVVAFGLFLLPISSRQIAESFGGKTDDSRRCTQEEGEQ